MANTLRHETRPLGVPRSQRNNGLRAMTSLPAGKVVPLAAFPLLREDALRGRMAFAFEMQQTVEVLVNGIDVVVEAWLIPNLAMPEFRTLDDYNLAFTGRKRDDVANPTPLFVREAAGADPDANQIHKRMGLHRKAGLQQNMSYVRSYNTLVNFARAEASPNIPQRELLDKTLAQALWPKNTFSHIVPDFDAAVMEGEVALNLAEQTLRLQGVGGTSYLPVADHKPNNTVMTALMSDGPTRNLVVAAGGNILAGGGAAGQTINKLNNQQLRADLTGATALLANNGFKLSMKNMELAQKAQVYANIRKKYNAHEEMIIDLLMDGITVPEQDWLQPHLLKKAQTRFGMAKRYSSDADALTASVVDGAAAVEFSISTPRVPCGGVVMVVAYIAPEQLFERVEDPYLVAANADDLPAFIEDHLDPQQVEIVKNDYIDSDHDQADDTFGYAPQNFKWNASVARMGGRFYRPEVDAGFDEDRNSIWAVETQNPRLTKDFYLVPADIHTKPFWTQTIDPFDCITMSNLVIEGNTQFGPRLIEAMPESDYDAIMAKVDQTRIEKEPVAP